LFSFFDWFAFLSVFLTLHFSFVQFFRSGSAHDLTGHIAAVFAACKAANRPAFVAYTTVGYPVADLSHNVALLKALQDSGADIIELGVPFTDPMADGPTIQRANQIALTNGVDRLEKCIAVAKAARDGGVHVPIVFMGYYNPFRSYGEQKLFSECHAAGVNGFIIVDLPPEESDSFRSACHSHHLSFIPLITPTTTPQRTAHLAKCADSFIYAVSLTGTTGTKSSVSDQLPSLISQIREHSSLPIAVGFGIGNAQQFAQVAKLSDGVVIGSAIINTIGAHSDRSHQLRRSRSFVTS
jgi:tryptophan synthase